MRKASKGYRIWKKNNDLKKHKYKIKRRKLKKNQSKEIIAYKNTNRRSPRMEVLTPPENFSLYQNTNEVIEFFNGVFKKISSPQTLHRLNVMHFTLKDINKISIETIMYMLAIIRNIKIKAPKSLKFEGDTPILEEPKKLFLDSGFVKYVNSRTLYFKENVECISIESGRNVLPEKAAAIIEFINEKIKITKSRAHAIYDMIIELMANTFDHAYNYNSNLQKSWYLYATAKPNKVMITFLDTGEGIPSTINKRFSEKIAPNASKLMKSAFEGSFRTKTKLDYRGRGLPRIYKNLFEKKISNLYVISGNGLCDSQTNNFFSRNIKLKHSFEGSLYFWEIAETEDNNVKD